MGCSRATQTTNTHSIRAPIPHFCWFPFPHDLPGERAAVSRKAKVWACGNTFLYKHTS